MRGEGRLVRGEQHVIDAVDDAERTQPRRPVREKTVPNQQYTLQRRRGDLKLAGNAKARPIVLKVLARPAKLVEDNVVFSCHPVAELVRVQRAF